MQDKNFKKSLFSQTEMSEKSSTFKNQNDLIWGYVMTQNHEITLPRPPFLALIAFLIIFICLDGPNMVPWIHEMKKKKKLNFLNSAVWTPNKQFCFSKSASFRIQSPQSKLWYYICSQVVK